MQGDTLEGGDTRVKAIKSDKAMSKKRSSKKVVRGDTAEVAKNRGVTPSVAAPCVTHPSDATSNRQKHTDYATGGFTLL